MLGSARLEEVSTGRVCMPARGPDRWLRVLPTALVIVATATGGSASASVTAPTTVARTQQLATLSASHEAYTQPDTRSTRIATVLAWRPITGQPTVLPIVGRATNPRGTRWLHVMLPGRPNGMRGWITQRSTELSVTKWRILVRLASRRLLAYRGGRLIRSFPAIVGKPSTPTPQGTFFVEETVAMPQGSAGAPFALALSARSNVLQEFDGGPGQIAIHGIENLGGTLGTAASHGCVRLATKAITWLANRVGTGTPVTIQP
jgi:lipoprotein-anchoring transpeptidase ErfK/SrfK